MKQGQALLTLALFSLFFNPAISRQSVTRHDEFPQVTGVQITSPHCGRPDGQLIISAYSPSGSDIEYSKDDGVTYFPDSIFSGLPAGMYIVRILDTEGLPGFYEDNPVLLTDIPGPQVLQVHITNETDFLGNGSIQVFASAGTPNVFFSIDSGISWQTNSGTFNNLHSGIYNVLVTQLLNSFRVPFGRCPPFYSHLTPSELIS